MQTLSKSIYILITYLTLRNNTRLGRMNTDPKVVLFTDYVSMCVGVLCVINSKNVNKKKLRVKSNRVYGNDVWRYKMLFGKMEEKTNR